MARNHRRSLDTLLRSRTIADGCHRILTTLTPAHPDMPQLAATLECLKGFLVQLDLAIDLKGAPPASLPLHVPGTPENSTPETE